jgi:hypothetical protein
MINLPTFSEPQSPATRLQQAIDSTNKTQPNRPFAAFYSRVFTPPCFKKKCKKSKRFSRRNFPAEHPMPGNIFISHVISPIASPQRTIITSGYSEPERVKMVQALGAGSYGKNTYSLDKLGLAVRKERDRPVDG